MQCNTYFKAMYLQFSNFAYKGRLVRIFFGMWGKIFTNDRTQNKEFIERSLLAIVYPENSIKYHRRTRKLRERMIAVERKKAFIVMLFESDQASRKFKPVIRNTQKHSWVLQTTVRISFKNQSNCLADPSVPNVVCNLIAITVTQRTNRYSFQQVPKDKLKWLPKSMTR